MFVRQFTETEMEMNSVERIRHYSELPTEPQLEVTEENSPDNWPSKGDIVFDSVSVRYRPGLPEVLKKLSATIQGGEKVGICGRTGSGKSSLTLALFRIIECHEGTIKIDGKDISQIPLFTLRSRLSIVPQDPVLFEHTIRYNLDPTSKFTDDQLWYALEIAQLKSVVDNLPNKLLYKVSEGGSNFSVGQRQMFCLARAFLRQSKILIMDEATASVDIQTDKILQKIIKTAFVDRTVLTIAHRISSILDSDKIMVLSEGTLVEYDTPQNLLQNPQSFFSSLVQANKL